MENKREMHSLKQSKKDGSWSLRSGGWLGSDIRFKNFMVGNSGFLGSYFGTLRLVESGNHTRDFFFSDIFWFDSLATIDELKIVFAAPPHL